MFDASMSFMFGASNPGRGGVLTMHRDECVALEYESNFLIFFSCVTRSIIPLRELQDVTLSKVVTGVFQRGWIVSFRARSLRTFRTVPGAVRERLSLYIAKEDVSLAERFISCAMLAITNYEIERMR